MRNMTLFDKHYSQIQKIMKTPNGNRKPKQRMLEKEEWHDHNQRDMPMDIQSWNTGGSRTRSTSKRRL